MEIKQNNASLFKRIVVKTVRSRLRWIILSIFCIIALSFIVLGSIYYGMILHKRGRARELNTTAKMALQSKLCIVPNFLRGLTATPKHISIDINYDNFQRLAYKRYVALKRGVLISSPDDYVPATITHNGNTVRTKVRLKGDLVDQLQGEKWPFRVIIRGEDTLFGMKVFSLHKPSARGYIYEWLLHKAMKREGIIGLRYDFIDVTLNGKHLGIYALEEHFEKRLIEDNQRREGPIVCFSEYSDIKNIEIFGWPTDKRLDFFPAEVDLYRPTETLATPLLSEQFMTAKNLLELYRSGKLGVADVFDIDILARYFAVLDLFNARHAAKFGNFKLYYNSITSKLEPICFDAEFVGEEAIYGDGIYAENWHNDLLDPPHMLFKDNRLFALYMKELKRISEPEYLNRLFAEIYKELNEKLNIIYAEYPHFYFRKDLFYSKQLYIKKILDFSDCVNAYFKGVIEEGDRRLIQLDVGNIRSIPLIVRGVSLEGNADFPIEESEKILQPAASGSSSRTEEIDFILPQGFDWKGEYANQLKLNYSLLGLDTIQSERVLPWQHLDAYFIENDFVRRPSNVRDFSFLSIDETEKKIYIERGDWYLDKSLIIPKDYKVVCNGGTTLNLGNSTLILSYSPFEFIGSEEEPIVIKSDDMTAQGIVVLNAKEPSVLRYVTFANLSSPSHKGWELTGAITFYESPVEIHSCNFINNNSEDGLNLVRSGFIIEASVFIKTLSDALDIDFSDGKILNSAFEECGNDAVDVSGSRIELRNLRIEGAGDKGLSVGEKSSVLAASIEIKNAKIALASKDTSELNISNVDIFDCKVACAVYKKKSEFGPASMLASKLVMEGVDVPYMVEEDSALTIDGKIIECGRKNVIEIINEF